MFVAVGVVVVNIFGTMGQTCCPENKAGQGGLSPRTNSHTGFAGRSDDGTDKPR